MNWYKKAKEELPSSMEERVSPEGFENVFQDYDSTKSLFPDQLVMPGENAYHKDAAEGKCPKCGNELADDYCIWCKEKIQKKEGQSYYNPDKNLDIGDKSEAPGDLFQPTPQPAGEEGSFTRIIEDY
jgi:hypothetical protein